MRPLVLSALLLRGAINHDTLTAPPGVVKPVEAEKPQAEQKCLRSLELKRCNRSATSTYVASWSNGSAIARSPVSFRIRWDYHLGLARNSQGQSGL
jgi:hypothetical protein